MPNPGESVGKVPANPLTPRSFWTNRKIRRERTERSEGTFSTFRDALGASTPLLGWQGAGTRSLLDCPSDPPTRHALSRPCTDSGELSGGKGGRHRLKVGIFSICKQLRGHAKQEGLDAGPASSRVVGSIQEGEGMLPLRRQRNEYLLLICSERRLPTKRSGLDRRRDPQGWHYRPRSRKNFSFRLTSVETFSLPLPPSWRFSFALQIRSVIPLLLCPAHSSPSA
ncbi:BQ5605_C008g05003 [Microbotryum silenes-dioicae]|uniref:BQ5605_C008g05003 protein n=1 Tax=Microbotryum silenes-dioicae TaxID=796604 RepID=A0A2X0MC37_9BASI|nr:BQ5605_C008g05003 [Microbotryum silenes-dioicae]